MPKFLVTVVTEIDEENKVEAMRKVQERFTLSFSLKHGIVQEPFLKFSVVNAEEMI